MLGDSATSQARALASLEQQRTTLTAQLPQAEAGRAKVEAQVKEATSKLQEARQARQQLESEIRSLGVKDEASRR